MNTRLLLIRHGQTEWNRLGRFQGHSDVPLNDLGQAQALAAARRVAAWVRADPARSVAAVYTSDLIRARTTAEIIRGELLKLEPPGSSVPPGSFVPLVIDPRLREGSFGAWEGLTYAEIEARDPAHLHAWQADHENVAPPSGETLLACAARLESAREAILAAHPAGTVVVAGHGGALQLLIASAIGLPPGRFWQLYLSNGSLSELSYYPEGAILNRLNASSHLDQVAE